MKSRLWAKRALRSFSWASFTAASEREKMWAGKVDSVDGGKYLSGIFFVHMASSAAFVLAFMLSFVSPFFYMVYDVV